MRIIIGQDEIERAIVEYIGKRFTLDPKATVTLEDDSEEALESMVAWVDVADVKAGA